MLYTGPARSRVTELHSAWRHRVLAIPRKGCVRLSTFQTHFLPLKGCQLPYVWLQSVSLQCFRISGAPQNLDMFCSFYEESDFQGVKAQRKTWLWYINYQQTKINTWPYSVDMKQSQRNKYVRPHSCRSHTSNNRESKNCDFLMKHLPTVTWKGKQKHSKTLCL